MTTKRVINFATNNAGKLAEVRSILNEVCKVNAVALDIDEYQGTAHEIARRKCLSAVNLLQKPVLIDDSCLCFNALGGLPGPYIKEFLKPLGSAGLYKMLSAFDDKTAYALCTLGYSKGPGSEVVLFQGRTDGIIVEPRGYQDFGWDPCFQPDDYDMTYAEMSSEMKNKISHRAKAFRSMKRKLDAIL